MSILLIFLALFLGVALGLLAARRKGPPTLDVDFQPLHDDVPLPERATEGSAAYDAFADIRGRTISVWRQGQPKQEELGTSTLVLLPQERAIVPLGFKLSFAHGAACDLMPKSGRAAKEGLTLANAVGLGDADYPSEYGAILVNIGTLPVTITHAEKVVQLCFVPVYEANFRHREVSQTTARSGGFGHSGLAPSSKSPSKS